MGHSNNASDIGSALGAAISNFGTYAAKAAANANGTSFASQNLQGNFNAGQAAIANDLGTNRILDQYAFNSGQAAMANQFTSDMWDRSSAWNEAMWEKTAAWNEMMMQRQMDFNAAEAQKNRDWQQKMAETSYQRAMSDMEKAGLNPILAAGGVSTGGGAGSYASIGGTTMSSPSMSSAHGQMASGGLVNGISASEGNFSGQMEYMGGMLGLLGAAISGVSSAVSALGNMGNIGIDIGENLAKVLGEKTTDKVNNYEPWYIQDGKKAGEALRNYIKDRFK